MQYRLTPLQPDHRTAVMDVFNYYVEHGFAAFFTSPLPHAVYDAFLQACKDRAAFAVETEEGETVGFGMLRPYHPGDALKRTGELSYFIAADHTRKGLGRMLLSGLIEEAARLGVDNLIASVASTNEPSLRFHRANGFEEAGRLRAAGRKSGQDFDVVLMQRRVGRREA